MLHRSAAATVFSLVALLVTALAWAAPALATPTLFTASGANPADIQATVDAFRAALGNPDNGNQGPQATGHREINWDGGGATDGTAAVTPFTTFQNTRGATFTTPGAGLTQTSITGGAVDIAPSIAGNQFNLAAFNATYGTQFKTFSPNRLFAPIGSTITDGTFSIPGTGGSVPAGLSGFGVVFTDVDIPGSTSIEFFDFKGSSLLKSNAPVGTLSFLGVIFSPEQITGVRITSGNTDLGLGLADSATIDPVAMDDFLFSEPRAIPEPATLGLLATGLLGMVLAARSGPLTKRLLRL
jgi:PEP-CTERM motif